MRGNRILESASFKIATEGKYQSETVATEVSDPVNPFAKRVFEKKMRRSSVASENTNPNMSICKDDFIETDICLEVDEIISKGRKYLAGLKKSALEQIACACDGGKNKAKVSGIIANL